MSNAEAMIRAQINNPSLQFSRVQFTGDDRSGQTCGYFTRRTADGEEVSTRFIVFIDGGGGQNPFVDDSSRALSGEQDDFQLNWRTSIQAPHPTPSLAF
jgi:hypothetical protein